MTFGEYREQNRKLWAELEAKNQTVNDFVDQNPDLLVDGVYERFWELQNEATLAIGKIQNFQANAQVSR